MKGAVIAALLAVVVASRAILISAQTSPLQKQVFEVASVKPHPPGFDPRTSTRIQGGRLVAMNYSLKRLVQVAYGRRNAPVLDDQIIGGPTWIETEYFDIEARAEDGSVSYEQTLIMLRSLLVERFQLRVRHEQRQLPVYDLVVARQGKLHLSADQTPPDSDDGAGSVKPGTLPRGVPLFGGSPLVLSGKAVRISTLATLLQTVLRQRVVDKTNLDGLFDISVPVITAIPETTALDPRSRNSPFTVPVEELGLRLTLTNASVEVIVIESVQRPSTN